MQCTVSSVLSKPRYSETCSTVTFAANCFQSYFGMKQELRICGHCSLFLLFCCHNYWQLKANRKYQRSNMSWKEEITFTDLPIDLKVHLASFLSSIDASHLSRVCKAVHSDFALSILDPFRLVRSSWIRGDMPCLGPQIPIFFSQTHSTILHCNWRVRSWGNLKGKLYIVAHKSNDTELHFSSGRLVASALISQHLGPKLILSFHPRSDETYHIWYDVIQGLRIDEIIVRSVVYDKKRSMWKAYRCLDSAGFLELFQDKKMYSSVVRALAQTLIRQIVGKEEPGLILFRFLESHEIDRESLAALEDLARYLQNYNAGMIHNEDKGCYIPHLWGSTSEIEAMNEAIW